MSKPTLRINVDSLKQRKEWKRHEINSGENIYRVLPPFGEEANGYPYRRWVLAWMIDPQSGRKRPFASPLSFGEKDCPVMEYSKAIEEKRNNLEAVLKSKGASKDQLKESLKPFGDILWRIKPKASFIYNACNKAGEVGLLELKKTAHDAMKKEMMQYVTDYGQDPTSLNSDPEDSGIWFKVKKEGEGTDTEYSVLKNQSKKKTADGLVFVDDREALPDNVVNNFETLGYDLQKLYKQNSYDEIKQVLLFNLAAIYEEYPMARLEGFDVDITLVATAPVQTSQAVIRNPRGVALRLDSNDEETAPVVVPAAKTSKQSKEEADLFAYADSLLNS